MPARPEVPPSPLPPRVVGVGASAGGLEALQQFLGQARAGTGLAYVVIQHQSPDHASMLLSLLQQNCPLPVREARSAMKVAPDMVYVVARDREITIAQGWLFQRNPREPRGRRMPIDSFFRSLARDQGSRGIGVVLSGMGDDGTRGLRAIRSERGLTMAQEPESARFASMPGSAIDAGICDVIASPADLGRRLVRTGSGDVLPESVPPSDETPLDAIIRLLRQHGRHDFSLYKQSTFQRRCERRMGIHDMADLAAYAAMLRHNPVERDLLSREVLIGVTGFFRDAEVWNALRDTVLPRLMAQRDPALPMRAWVVGCSTGEEAYSLAMVFREAAEAQTRSPPASLQIFATDLSADAIAVARKGYYRAAALRDVSAARLERHFVADRGGYRVDPRLREMVLFTQHNVIDDPPFTRQDLICCRNLMIYFTPSLQQRLLPLFHFAMRPASALLLGASETVGRALHLFTPLDAGRRLYRRAEPVGEPGPVDFPVQKGARPRADPTDDLESTLPVTTTDETQAHITRILLQQFAPAAVLVNEGGDILYVSGRTGRFLQPAAGRANWNVHAMAHESVRAPLAMALRQALLDKRPVALPTLDLEGQEDKVDIVVTPLDATDSVMGAALIAFREASTSTPAAATEVTGLDPALTRELSRCQAEIRMLREQMRASAEAVQAANEELQSSNEELQSANEELTTSKEESQAMNEELHTINAELQARVDDLAMVQSDMQNLLDSTDIATLFLDSALNVRRFTQHMERIVPLRDSDVGRPLADLASTLIYPDLPSDTEQTLRTLVYSEKQIATTDAKWFSVRIMPYRTVAGIVQGVVITFIDITSAKNLEERLRRRDTPPSSPSSHATERLEP